MVSNINSVIQHGTAQITVFNYLKQNGNAKAADIALNLGMSRPKVTRILQALANNRAIKVKKGVWEVIGEFNKKPLMQEKVLEIIKKKPMFQNDIGSQINLDRYQVRGALQRLLFQGFIVYNRSTKRWHASF